MTTTLRRLLVFGVTWFSAPSVFAADAVDQQQGSPAAWLWGLFWTFLPIAIVLLVFAIFFKRALKPQFERNNHLRERQVEHMERIEKSLSRIIELLERKT